MVIAMMGYRIMNDTARQRWAVAARGRCRRLRTPPAFILFLVVALPVFLHGGACAADTERLGLLTANRDDLQWTPAEGAPVSGQHRDTRLDPTLWRQLADVFTGEGLKLGGRIVPPNQLLIQVIAVTGDSVEIAFERLDAPRGAAGSQSHSTACGLAILSCSMRARP
jgi:hypothetical protein